MASVAQGSRKLDRMVQGHAREAFRFRRIRMRSRSLAARTIDGPADSRDLSLCFSSPV